MEDDAPQRPGRRPGSARPARPAQPPAALFMEPTVPLARRSPEPVQQPPTSSPPVDRTPPQEEAPRARPPKAAPAKKTAAKKAAAPAKKAAAPVQKATVPAKKAAAPAKTAAPKKAAAPAKKATRQAKKTTAAISTTSTRVTISSPQEQPAQTAAVPVRLAQAAVERFGDRAERHVRWLRERYPQATEAGLARAVTERFAGRPWFTALAGTAGLGALLAAQAELVLHLAAVYGRDPRALERVPELVDLLAPRGLAASAGSRLAGRLLPGAGVVFGLLADRGALEAAGRRAIAYYRAS